MDQQVHWIGQLIIWISWLAELINLLGESLGWIYEFVRWISWLVDWSDQSVR